MPCKKNNPQLLVLFWCPSFHVGYRYQSSSCFCCFRGVSVAFRGAAASTAPQPTDSRRGYFLRLFFAVAIATTQQLILNCSAPVFFSCGCFRSCVRSCSRSSYRDSYRDAFLGSFLGSFRKPKLLPSVAPCAAHLVAEAAYFRGIFWGVVGGSERDRTGCRRGRSWPRMWSRMWLQIWWSMWVPLPD